MVLARSAMDGILNVWKPRGLTSFDVVRQIRRWTKVSRVGHGGTLDPLAEGVLVVFLGQATRMVEFMGDVGKTYTAVLRLGIQTDTYDSDGLVLDCNRVPPFTLAEIDTDLDCHQNYRGWLIS